VYIPTPEDEIEEIPLAPLDEDVLRGQGEMEAEDQRLIAELGRAEDSGGGGPSEPAGASAGDIVHMIVEAVVAMKASRLEEAEQIIRRLRRSGDAAKAQIQALMVDELPPPELEDCPPALYKGFLRKILDQF
jgi:hypothetical protein